MDSTPTRKVTAGAISGALSVIVVWLIGATTSLEVPPEVAVAFSTVFSFALSWLVTEPGNPMLDHLTAILPTADDIPSTGSPDT